MMKEIQITDIQSLRIGNAQDDEAKTGVTAVLFDNGAKVGVDISGGGPASRETPIAAPTTAETPVNAILLAGGSAYGLDAAGGAMRFLEEHGIGYDTGFARIPIVLQSCIYDLSYGSSTVRPDAEMGYNACLDAFTNNMPACGNVGAGSGATVGKLCGMKRASKAGLGIYAVQVGQLQMGAVVVVNSLGDICSPKGEKISGLMNSKRNGFSDSVEELLKIAQPDDLFGHLNTTLGVIITNADFNKTELNKIASMTRAAYSRCIRPVGTMADGDTIYAVSKGTLQADINMAGTLAAEVMAKAIQCAVEESRIDDEEFLKHVL